MKWSKKIILTKKVNLMMLKRDINWKYTYNRLDNCFTDEMKQMLEDHYSEEKS